MRKVAIYPGTFDPITFGHIDIIKKSLKIVDKLIVATTDSSDKDYFFSLEERLEILEKSLFKDLRLNKNKIRITSFNNLTVIGLSFLGLPQIYFWPLVSIRIIPPSL